MAPKDKSRQEPQDLLGIEKFYNIFKRWAIDLPQSKARLYLIVGIIVSIALIAVTIFVPFIPTFVFPFLTWPIGVFVFFTGLYIAINYAETHEDHVTIKERFSFKQRIRITIISSVIFLVLLLYFSQWLPSALGGTFLVSYLLTAINVVRRTPGEIELANLGLVDERDMSEEEMEEARQQFFAENGDLDEEDEVL